MHKYFFGHVNTYAYKTSILGCLNIRFLSMTLFVVHHDVCIKVGMFLLILLTILHSTTVYLKL